MDPCSNLACRLAPTQDGTVGLMKIRHICHKVVEEVGFPFGSLVHFPKTSRVLQYAQQLSNRPRTLTRTL